MLLIHIHYKYAFSTSFALNKSLLPALKDYREAKHAMWTLFYTSTLHTCNFLFILHFNAVLLHWFSKIQFSVGASSDSTIYSKPLCGWKFRQPRHCLTWLQIKQTGVNIHQDHKDRNNKQTQDYYRGIWCCESRGVNW